MKESADLRVKKFKRRTVSEAIKILGIFAVPAFLGLPVGRFIDTQFDVEPLGSLITMIFCYALSWILVFKLSLPKNNK